MSENIKVQVMEDLEKREDSLRQIRAILEKICELSYDADCISEAMFNHVEYFRKYNHRSCWLKCMNEIDEVKMDIRGAQLALYEVVKSEQQQIQGIKEIWEKETP